MESSFLYSGVVMDSLQAELITLVRAVRVCRLSAADFERVVCRQYFIESLLANNVNLCATAREIGLHRNTLTRKLHALDINIAVLRRTWKVRRKSNAKQERISGERQTR